MKVKTKTDRQIKEAELYDKYKLAWKLSLQYSTILNNNLHKPDIVLIAYSVYEEYMHSLKSNDMISKNNLKNYQHLWITMINTIIKDKYSIDKKKSIIKNVYYTSLKKNNM